MSSSVVLPPFDGRLFVYPTFLTFLFLSFFLLFASPAEATTYVSGTIIQDTTWNTADSPYVLINDGDNNAVIVAPGVTLTIEPGVIVKGQQANTYLEINGILNADGATFTSLLDDTVGGDTNEDGSVTSPSSGDWDSIYFAYSSSGTLSNTTIRYGGGGAPDSFDFAELMVDSDSPLTITNCQINSSVNSGVVVFGGSAIPSISGSTITGNSGYGLNGPALLTDSTLSGNGAGGLYSTMPVTILSSNTFTGNNGPAVNIPATIGPGVTGNTYYGNSVNGMILTGNVTQNTIWTTANAPYVPDNVTVDPGVTLTVNSGTVVKPRTSDSGITVSGTLNADGATFTSLLDDTVGGDTNEDGSATSPSSGDWDSINYSGGSSGTIANSTVKYGGIDSSTYALSIWGTSVSFSACYGLLGPASVAGSTFSNNECGGMYSSDPITTLTSNSFIENNGPAVRVPGFTIGASVSGNSFTGNSINEISLSGYINQDIYWPTKDTAYVLEGTVTVAAGKSLTIQPGVVVKPLSTTSNLNIYGVLNMDGAVFTSLKDDDHGGDTNGDESTTFPAPGDWYSIKLAQGSSGSITNTTLLWGGYSNAIAMLYIDTSGSVAISGSTFSHSGANVFGRFSNGVQLSWRSTNTSISGSTFSLNQIDGLYAAAPMANLSGNTFTGNGSAAVQLPSTLGANVVNNTYSGNQINAMVVASNITQPTTWSASNSPYVAVGAGGGYNQWSPFFINAGATLTIEPDVVVKMGYSGTHSRPVDTCIVAYGALNATNTVFTSFYDDSDGGDTNGDGGDTMAAPGDWGNIDFEAGSSGNIVNSELRYGGWNATSQLYVNSASPTITGNAISHSLGSGVKVYNSSSAYIHFNDIFANGTYGFDFMYDDNHSGIDGTNNYWGSKGGPKPFGNGNGYKNGTWGTNPVTVNPWSKIPFTQAGAAYAATLGLDNWCAQCGDPINMSTGAFVYAHTDIQVPAKGIPLNFVRTYNSNDEGDGALGYGWSQNWQLSPNPLANGDVVILRGDGRQDRFTKNADASFSSPAGRHDLLLKNQDGTYTMQSQDKKTYAFDASNSLSSVVSENGQTTAFTYDANKRLTTVTDPAGRTLTVAYDQDNRIEHVSDPEGNTVTFGYSSAGDLTTVTDQNGGVTSYAYDDNHRITGITDPNGHTSANNTYDAQGRVVNQTDAENHLINLSYDSANKKTTLTRQMAPGDPSQDQVNTFYHDDNYRLIRQVDAFGKETLYTYDAAGNQDSATDRRGTVSRKVFDSSGNVTDEYKANGAPEQEHTSYTYNAKNRPLTKTDSRGFTTGYAYDSNGTNLIQVSYPAVTNYAGAVSNYSESFSYNPDGTVATKTDKNGNVTSYTYNGYGSLTSETRNTNQSQQDQVTISYSYDILGRKAGETDGNGHQTTYQYDNLGNLRYQTKQVTDPGTGQLVNVTTESQYDAAGNKTTVIDPEGKTTNYSFTAMNRLSQTTDAKGYSIQYTYDSVGNKTSTKDRNGNWTYTSFDKNNRMASATDPESNVTIYGYDEEGNQTSVSDPLGRVTSKVYDRLGRVISSTEPDEGSTTRTTTYAYDAAGNLTSTTDPSIHTTTYVYDELGRLKQATDPLGNSSYAAYDGLDNKVKAKDAKGNETSFAFSPNNWLITVTDPTASITGYAYDKEGNRTQQTDAGGRVTIYSYDELNRLKEKKVDAGAGSYLLQRSYTFDKTGHMLTDTTGAGTITNTYDDVYNLSGVIDRQEATYSYTYDNNQNQLSAIENATGKTVSFSYSSRGLLSEATNANGGSENYAYDGAGNLSQRQDTVAGQNFTTSYDYTPRNQMKTVAKGTDTSIFTYDPAGNLSSEVYPNGVNTSYSYDAGNRLTAQQALKNGQSLQSFNQNYDSAGNITSSTQAGLGTTSYTYDALNRLTSENISGYGTTGYTYDKTGNRLTRTEPKPTGGPTLSLSRIRSYWATYSDYQASQLSIDYRITDNGPGTAIGAKVTNSTATNGVYLTSNMPLALGNINQGSYAPFTLKYFVPTGVVSFTTTTYSTCENAAGTDFYYPEKKSFYSYNQANQLTTSRDAQGNATAYTYNPSGAVSQKTTGTSTTTNDYNGLDQLTGVTQPTAAIAYAYDPLGRREARTESGQTTISYFMGQSDLEDYQTDGDGNLTYSALRGADGLISETEYTGQTPITAYNLYNPHGDTTTKTDQSGAVTASYRYDSFGNPISQSSPRDGYTGKWQREKDSATGTIRMGVREYDPALGRFMSADSLKGDPTDPQQRNLYDYTGDNPSSRYDLDGRSWKFDGSGYDENAERDKWAAKYGRSCVSVEAQGGQDINDYLGYGLHWGAFSYSREEDQASRSNYMRYIYRVTIPGDSLRTTADNPYISQFADSLHSTILKGAFMTLGLWIDIGAEATHVLSLPDVEGAKGQSESAEKLRDLFQQMQQWQRECGSIL